MNKKYNEIQIDFFLYDLKNQIQGQTPRELERVLKGLEGYEGIIAEERVKENLKAGIKLIQMEIEKRC
jgi:hypothetical protein